MRYFAGLDVSLEETAICVVDETGLIMKEGARCRRTGSTRHSPFEPWPAAGDRGLAAGFGRDHGDRAAISELLPEPSLAKPLAPVSAAISIPPNSGAAPVLPCRCPGCGNPRAHGSFHSPAN